MSGYSATYPNPQQHQWVRVGVNSDGRVVVACRSAQLGIGCGDSPVYARVEPTPDGWVVRAYDVYQQRLAELPYTGGRCRTKTPIHKIAPSGNDATPAPPLTEGTPAGMPAGVNPGDPNVALSIESSGDGPEDGEREDDSHPESCGDPNLPRNPGVCGDDAKARFCKLVNDGLESRHLAFRYQCAHLGLGLQFPKPSLGGDVHCKREIVSPATRQVLTEFSGCAKTVVREWENTTVEEIRNTGLCGGSPLVLDLDGDGVKLTPLSEGVNFDLLGTGRKVHQAWVSGADGLLVMDRNRNGIIDDGSELFGNVTAGRSWEQGFAPLAELDANHDGEIDSRDPQFSNLRIWVDRNHDGVGPASEWLRLDQAGVASLHVAPHRLTGTRTSDRNGNWVPLVSHFTRLDGTRGQLVDAWFSYRPVDDAKVSLLPACFSTAPN